MDNSVCPKRLGEWSRGVPTTESDRQPASSVAEMALVTRMAELGVRAHGRRVRDGVTCVFRKEPLGKE